MFTLRAPPAGLGAPGAGDRAADEGDEQGEDARDGEDRAEVLRSGLLDAARHLRKRDAGELVYEACPHGGPDERQEDGKHQQEQRHEDAVLHARAARQTSGYVAPDQESHEQRHEEPDEARGPGAGPDEAEDRAHDPAQDQARPERREQAEDHADPTRAAAGASFAVSSPVVLAAFRTPAFLRSAATLALFAHVAHAPRCGVPAATAVAAFAVLPVYSLFSGPFGHSSRSF